MIRILLLLLLVCTPVFGVTIVSPPAKGPLDQVTLASAQAATGLAANAIDTRNGFRSMCAQVTNSAGTSTVSLSQSCNAGGNWGDVFQQNSAVPDALSVTTVNFCVQSPQCSYTINVTACTGCSVTAIGQVGAKVP